MWKIVFALLMSAGAAAGAADEAAAGAADETAAGVDDEAMPAFPAAPRGNSLASPWLAQGQGRRGSSSGSPCNVSGRQLNVPLACPRPGATGVCARAASNPTPGGGRGRVGLGGASAAVEVEGAVPARPSVRQSP